MTDTVYTDFTSPNVSAAWLNDVNNATYRGVQKIYAVDTGPSANVYALTIPGNFSSLSDGQSFLFRALHSNTSASTIQITSSSTVLAAVPLVKPNSSSLLAGDITANSVYTISYSVSLGSFVVQGATTPSPASIAYALDTGVSNAMVYTVAGVGGYVDGLLFMGKVAATSTSSTVTINVNAFGLKNVYLEGGGFLAPGGLVQNNQYLFAYDSSLNGGVGGFTAAGAVNHQQVVTINAINDWGIDPTGAVDATTAIQNGLNALPTNSVIALYFPPGLYTISSTITIPTGLLLQPSTLGATGTHPFGGLTILGAGKGVTIFQMASGVTTSSFFSASAGSGQKGWRCIFRDLSMIALSTSYNAYHVYFINLAFSGCVRCSFHSANTSAAAVAGVYYQGNIGGTVSNQNYFVDSLAQGASLVFDACADCMVVGSYVYAQSVSGGAGGRNFGINLINNSNDVKLTGCHIGCAPIGAINIGTGGGNSMIATGCFFDTAAGHSGSEYSIYSTVAGIYGGTVSGCWFNNILASPIQLTDPTGWTITGNTFVNANSSNVGANTINITFSATGMVNSVIANNTFLSSLAGSVYAIANGSASIGNVIGPNSITGSMYITTGLGVQGAYNLPAPSGSSVSGDIIDGVQRGTYTPVLSTVSGGTPTGYTTQFGSFSKSGDTVTFTARIQITGTGTLVVGSGVTITLPFNTNALANQYFSFVVSSNNLGATAPGECSGAATNSIGYLVINKYSGGTSSPVVPADLTATSVFTVTGSFKV